MRRKLFATLLALAAFTGSIKPVAAADANFGQAQPVANIDLARIRNVLRLTPAQEPYWPAVESALRRLSQEQGVATSYIGRLKRGALGIVLNSTAVARLAAAARPLLGVLDDRQRQAAFGLAQEMGLGPMLAALN